MSSNQLSKMLQNYKIAVEHFRESKVVLIDADDALWPNYLYYLKLKHKLNRILLREGKTFDELFYTMNSLFPGRKNGEAEFAKAILDTTINIGVSSKTRSVINKAINDFLDYKRVPFPETYKSLKRLSSEKDLFIYTMGPIREQERKLASSGLSNFFCDIIAVEKKDSDSLRDTLRYLKKSPNSVSAIGDSLHHDILPCYEVLPCVYWLTDKQHLLRNFDPPLDPIPETVFIFRNLFHLSSILCAMP